MGKNVGMGGRVSGATQHRARVDRSGMDEEMAETLGVNRPHSSPAGRKRAAQQPGESDKSYLKRQKKRVNDERMRSGRKPL